ncbi:MAG TPA: AAA family ATPase, partial [Actinomycetes bacterium]|nr:AAA family ATPase [Actinomycetes bacterium]
LHPALTRLQPGRRVLSSHEEGESAALDRADLFEAVHELLEEAAALDRTDLFEAVHALLEAVGAKAPVLVVIEDVHWADQSTRDMLSFLFSRPFEGSVAVVASYRSDDLHRRHPLRTQVAEWSRIRGVERIQLQPLGAPDVRTLISELHPDPLPPEEVAGIVDRAEGNAFFVEELVGATAVPGRWVSAELADVLLVRLDRLDDTARQVARAASVAGRRVSHDMLAAAAGLAPGDLDAGLRGAVETNVLVADERGYAFRHALLGEAVYDDLLPGERVRLHAAYARALSSGTVTGTAAELARHARLALDLVTALTASVEAGDEARLVGGPDEAAHHYQQALELMADPERAREVDVDLSKLVVKAVESLTASGHWIRGAALAREQLERLPADAPAQSRARMLAARADALLMIETDENPAEVSAEALALVPEDFPQLRAKVLAMHARTLSAMGRDDEAEPAGLEALELAEKLDMTELASDAITTLSGLKRAGPKEGLREALTEAVARAEAAGAIEAELRGRVLLGRSYQDWAEFSETETWFRSAIDRSRAAGIPWAPWSFDARWQLAWVHRTRGEWDDVLALTEVAGEEPPPLARALLDTLRATVALARGQDVAGLVADLRRYWHKEGLVAIHSSPMEMELAGRRRDAAGVVRSYDEAVATMARIWHPWFSARIRLAAVAIGELARVMPQVPAAERPTYLEHAERLRSDAHTVLDRYTDPKDSWGPEGRAWFKRVDAESLRVRWLAGVEAPDVGALVSTWQETVTLTAEFGDVYELARVRAALAGIQRAAGDTAAARELG